MPTPQKEFLLKADEAEQTYQTKLTAGTNITISPSGVISAAGSSGGGSTVSVQPNHVAGDLIGTITVNGTPTALYGSDLTFVGASTQTAGTKGLVPAPTTNDVGKVLSSYGNWISLPEQTTITPNPVTTASASLQKILIGNTTYEIPDTTYSPGTNIQINGTTISATDTTYSDFSGSSHGLVPPVSTQSSKFLKDDGTWDTPPIGNEVEANPAGTPSATLTSISVDNVVYDIPSGGGGTASIDTIFTGLTAQTVTLNHTIEDYKMIKVFIDTDGQNTYQLEGAFTPLLLNAISPYGLTKIYIIDPYGLSSGFYCYKFTDATHMEFDSGQSSSFNRPMVVLGFK